MPPCASVSTGGNSDGHGCQEGRNGDEVISFKKLSLIAECVAPASTNAKQDKFSARVIFVFGRLLETEPKYKHDKLSFEFFASSSGNPEADALC